MTEDNRRPDEPPTEEGNPAQPAPVPESPGGADKNADKNADERADRDGGKPADDGKLKPEPEPQTTAERLRKDNEIRDTRAASTGSGDAVGGDKIINRIRVHQDGEGPPWVTIPYPAEERARLLARLAATPTREELAQRLERTPVAVLAGEAGTGRTTVALAALDGYAERLCVLDGKRTPAELSAEVLEKRHGYVYDASDARWASRLQGKDLFGCGDALKERDARLVVIVPPDADTTEVREYVVKHQPLDPWRVLEAHIRADLPGPDVDRTLQELTGLARDGSAPQKAGEAAGLAAEIRDGLGRRRTVREIWVEWFDLTRRARTLLGSKNETSNPTGRRAFVVAAAVMDGLPIATVARTAQDLANRLHRVQSYNKGGDKGLGQPIFGENLDDWLKHLGVDPPGVDRTLRLRRSGLDHAVLRVVWQDYVVAHGPLLSWLNNLVNDDDVMVRLKAAMAVGRLAAYDFDAIESRCFARWAGRKQMTIHQVTAWALEEVVKNAENAPDLRERVLDLAGSWSAGGPARRSTALRVYGTLLGMLSPHDAMHRLWQIAVRGDEQLQPSVVVAVKDLFVGGAAEPVIADLAEWARSPHAAVRVAVARIVDRIGRFDAEERPGWPALLVVFTDAPDPVEALWRRVLMNRVAVREPWRVLQEWSERAKRRRDLGEAFDALVERLAAEPFLRPRIAFHLRTEISREAR